MALYDDETLQTIRASSPADKMRSLQHELVRYLSQIRGLTFLFGTIDPETVKGLPADFKAWVNELNTTVTTIMEVFDVFTGPNIVSTLGMVNRLLENLLLSFGYLLIPPLPHGDQIPPAVSKQMEGVVKIIRQWISEIMSLRRDFNENPNLPSLDNIAQRLREAALSWKKYELALSEPVKQVQASLRENSGDAELNRLANDLLPTGLKELRYRLSCLEIVQPEHLAPHEEWFGRLYPPEYDQDVSESTDASA